MRDQVAQARRLMFVVRLSYWVTLMWRVVERRVALRRRRYSHVSVAATAVWQ